MGAPAVRRVSAEATRGLRHRVLRPHQPVDACSYPGDDAEDTLHLEATLGAQRVGVASLYRESREDAPGSQGWRLRGMAVAPEEQGKGVGRVLLDACLEHVRSAGGDEVWCNARATAARFYRRMGFVQHGEEFELPGLGPHFVMRAPRP